MERRRRGNAADEVIMLRRRAVRSWDPLIVRVMKLL